MQFLESICYKNGEYQNLPLHQERINKTCFHFFGESLHNLDELLPTIEDERTFKVRFVYDNTNFSIDPLPYVKLPIRTIQIVETDWFDYSFKYEDRQVIKELLQSAESDEIMITIDGLVTDCSYANLAFWDGMQWLTPEMPLLEGIKRATLLQDGSIKKARIPISELRAFQKVSLINAMLDLGDLEIPLDHLKSQAKT